MDKYTAIITAIKYLANKGVKTQEYVSTFSDIVTEHWYSGKVSYGKYKELLEDVGVKAAPGRWDPKDPNRKQKTEVEKDLHAAFSKRLESQMQQLRETNGVDFTLEVTDEFAGEVADILATGAMSAIENMDGDFDSSKPNEYAVEWSKTYAYDLIKGIDDTSRDVVSNAISDFVETPGNTIGDIVEQLSVHFGDDRAWMIATTETTRAFAEGQKQAAEEIRAEFPDVRMTKTWFTNNDDRVCDECSPLDGVEIDIDQEFSAGGGDPPLHVNCRCWIEYNTRI